MSTDNTLTKYGSLLWANYLGDENILSEYSDDYQFAKTQNGGMTPNIATHRYRGSSTDLFISRRQVYDGPDTQYNHTESPLNYSLSEKIQYEVLNYQDGYWGGPGFFQTYPVHYFRNKGVGWQSFEVDKSSTFMLGYYTSYSNWNAVLVQGYPEPSYWLVQSFRGSPYSDRDPLGGFVPSAYMDPRQTKTIGNAVANETFPGWDFTFKWFSPIRDHHPIKRPLPDATSGYDFRKVDIIESWGYTSSSPQEMFDDSGEGGPCFNYHSGCYIIIIDGVQIARIPIQGGMGGYEIGPEHKALHVRFRPDNNGLAGYYDPTGTPIRVKNCVNWLVNYRANWWDGDNTNNTGPKWTDSCYDQKQFSPYGLGEDCYSVSINTALGLNSLDAWRPNPFWARFARHAKTAGNYPIAETSTVYPPKWSEIPYITWGTFPQYGANVCAMGFAWEGAPHAGLWVTMGYGSFTVIDPETGFVPQRYLKLFFQIEEEQSADVNNKTWVFKPEDLLCIERQETSGASYKESSLDSVQQQVFNRLFDSSNEITVTANF
jgi:hypothetical protein